MFPANVINVVGWSGWYEYLAAWAVSERNERPRRDIIHALFIYLSIYLFICQVKAISREKQEEEVKAQEDSNSRHATRHQVGLL